MTIVELLDAVGAEHLSYQKLDDCLVSAQSVRGGVDVKFGTNVTTVAELCGASDPKFICFIVWVPVEHAARAQARIDAERQARGDSARATLAAAPPSHLPTSARGDR